MDYKDAWRELKKRRLGVAEIESGFEYQFPGDSDTLRLLYDWISLEQKCCPLFTIRASHENEPILLQLTGNSEAKAFLREELNDKIQMITALGENNLISKTNKKH
ncbi:hypothetical protein BK120_23675 [Paenibacillus sp. FSL A5-0031]|nr:hypothetical protein BK120_23675 [Paenibacillus sp. FSL A5-0031]